MTKIMHIITGTGIGGAESMLFNVCTRSNANFDILVVSLLGIGATGSRLADSGVKVRSLNMRKDVPNPFGLGNLRRIVAEFQPDVAISWLYHADLLATLLKLLGVKLTLLWNIRGSDRGDERSSMQRILSRMSALPAGIIVNSNAGLLYHTKIGYHPSEWHIIPNAIDSTRFHPNLAARAQLRAALGLDQKTRLIGFPARFHPIKGHSVFLEAAARLVSHRSDVVFLLMGDKVDSQNDELRTLITMNGLWDRVRLLGESTSIETIYAGLDLVSLSSWSEGFPNVLGEAMACEIPCISTDAGDARLIIGAMGDVVPRGDADALATSWNRFLSIDTEELRLIGKAARQRVQDRYSLHSVIAKYDNLMMRYAGKTCAA